MQGLPTHCHFEHPGFTSFGPAVFRLTQDDRVAALALHVDHNDVVLPLRTVARLFGLRPDSADARMLHLIEQGLRFVSTLRVGDKLPDEVLTGEASWQPGDYHREVAAARLHLQLVHWIGGIATAGEARVTSQMLLVSMQDPAIRPRVQEGLRQAAAELGITGGGPAVAALIETLAHELSYIEALRDRLLEPVRALCKALLRLGQDETTLIPTRRETLFQVTRLATAALADIAATFDHVDQQTADILPALRNLEGRRGTLRTHRDQLYATQRAWDPPLRAWNTAQRRTRDQDGLWRSIDELYRFLAPRYMSVQPWAAALPGSDRMERAKAALTW